MYSDSASETPCLWNFSGANQVVDPARGHLHHGGGALDGDEDRISVGIRTLHGREPYMVQKDTASTSVHEALYC